MRSIRLKLGLLLLLSAGCGDDPEPSLPCDVTSRACQRAVFRATAETRGQADAKLPPVRVISRKQLAAELRASIEHQNDTRDEEQVRREEQGQRALALLGLLPPPATQSADDAYIEQSVATIAAYYSHGSKDITVIADQTDDPDDATVTLSHEFVHALQDQRDGLSGLRSRFVQTTDDDIALTSLVEGEATWLSYATYYREVRDVPVDQINYERLFDNILTPTLGSIEESSAPLIDASELLPYPVGGLRVAELQLDDGPARIEELYDAPPLALRWWIADAPSGLPFQLECDLPEAPEGYERFDSDRLGFAGMLAFRSSLGESGMEAYLAAEQWRGDAISAYGSLSDPEQAAVVWRITLDSESAAQALAALTEGSSDVTADVQGTSVVLSAANDTELLESWLPGSACPALPKSRTRHTRALLAALKQRLGVFRGVSATR